MNSSEAWSASRYLRFADERTRPARDLLAQVPLEQAGKVFDLGCGPGNSTELLVARFPQATITGIDNAPDMIAAARKRLPDRSFEEADLAAWSPPRDADLLYSNAVFQWVPDHQSVLARLLSALRPGGVLAVQMPDNKAEPSHRLMDETAEALGLADRLAGAGRGLLPSPEGYYDLLKPLCSRLEIWHTVYNHALDGPAAIAAWFESTALRPYLGPLAAEERRAFLDGYVGRLAQAYPLRFDGKSLLRFPRLFMVAVR